MGLPSFTHGERATFDHEHTAWLGRGRDETSHETTERLVLHGLRMGKSSVQKLAFHAGLSGSARGQLGQALQRLEARGLVKRDGKAWVLA